MNNSIYRFKVNWDCLLENKCLKYSLINIIKTILVIVIGEKRNDFILFI